MDGFFVEDLRFGDVVLLGLSGELDDEGAPAIERAVAAAVDGGAKVVELGVAGVTQVDSGGLDVLLRVRRRLLEAEVHLRLLLPSKAVRRILEVTDTVALFEVVDP